MPQRHRPPYPDEFRRPMVELVTVGRSREELAEQFEPAQAVSGFEGTQYPVSQLIAEIADAL
jgi:hypothetical protein